MTKRKLLMAAVLVVGLVGCGRGPAVSSDNRNASRMFFCTKCGFAEEADAKMLQQRYADGKVQGSRFGCSACDAMAAELIVIDLSYTPFACSTCGKERATKPGEVIAAAKAGEAQMAPSGELRLRCPKCETFTCIQASTEDTEESPQ